MPIDTSRMTSEGLTYTRLKSWEHNGHEVALFRLENANVDPPIADVHLMCECDFDTEDVVEEGKVVGIRHKRDPYECASKQAIQELVTAQSQPSCQAVLAEKGLKEAILDVYRRVKEGEYLGQAVPSFIYAQEVARLLETDLPDLMKAVDELFAEEKLDLNGMILMDYVRRFRFPREIQWMFRMMVESPLGWPNGDAGDGVIETMEGAIDAHTRYKHGKDAFWEHNFPHVDPLHLAEFGHAFLAMTLARAEEDAAVRERLEHVDKEALADSLEAMASVWRSLGGSPSVGQGPISGGELLAIVAGATQEFDRGMQRARQATRAAMERYRDWLALVIARGEKDGCDPPEALKLVRRLHDSIDSILRLDDGPPDDGGKPPAGDGGGNPPPGNDT